jgi:hypothetical protein
MMRTRSQRLQLQPAASPPGSSSDQQLSVSAAWQEPDPPVAPSGWRAKRQRHAAREANNYGGGQEQ